MPRFPKPCTQCGALSLENLCPVHAKQQSRNKERARDRTSGNRARKSQLYNYAYRQEAKRVKAEATHCHICNQPFVEGDRVEADHLIPGLQGSPLAPAHARCNQSRGNKPLNGLA